MIFLIEYDRRLGRLISSKEFEASARPEAEEARFERELALYRSGSDREVVRLDAASVESLRRTHGRYFYTLTELLEQFAKSIAEH
jgi:hypothetical protein